MRKLAWIFLIIATGVCGSYVAYSINHSRSRVFHEEKGFRLLENHETEKASSVFADLLESDPKNPRGLEGIAKSLLVENKVREALPYLQRWYQVEPNSPKALRTYFGALVAEQGFEEAKPLGRKILDLEPGDRITQLKLATVHLAVGEYSEADELLKDLLETQPNDPGLLKLLAETERGQGNLQGAIHRYRQILFIQPNNHAAMMGLAVILHENQQSAEAIPLFRRIVEQDPTRQRTARYHLGLALARSGKTAEAQKIMDEVQRYQEAEAAIDDLPLKPNDPDAIIRASKGLFFRKDPTRAIVLLKDLLVSNPDFAPAHLLLSDYFDTIGNREDANYHRQKAKRLR